MSHSSTSAGHEQARELTSVETRLASLEARFANSWATQTRDEYEKAIKENLKQEIMNYARNAVIAAALFILGAGYVLIKSATVQIFEDRSARLSDEVREKANKEIIRERQESDWRRLHDYGITYRYLAEFWEGTPLSQEQKHKFYLHAFDKAEEYYSAALGIASTKAQTYYERAQLHYALAKRFELPEWKDDKQALDDYNNAAQYYGSDDVQRGWRADAYKEIGMIYLEWALSTTPPEKANLTHSFDYLSKAEHEYERSLSSNDVKDGLAQTKKLMVCFRPDGSLSNNCDLKALSDLLAAPL